MRLFTFIVLASTAAAASGVGMYPLELPHGDAQLAQSAVAHLRAYSAPVETVEASACAPDEDVCLAAAARRQGLSSIVTAAVQSEGDGYRLHVRAFGADRKLIGEWRGEGELGESLQRGICASLGGSCDPKTSENLGEKTSENFGGKTSERSAVPPEALGIAAETSPRRQAELVLFAGGVGLLSAAAGVALYAKATSQGRANGTPTANTFALALAATGLGAIGASGVVMALTPSGATLQAKF
ncbi:MAG TPA: hypothetical protein VGH20_03510 [Myxococcales bacterium]|jgi:hypothetical protein